MMASLPGDRVSEPQEKGAFDNEAEPERCHLGLSVKGSPQARVFGDLILSRRCCLEGAVEPPRDGTLVEDTGAVGRGVQSPSGFCSDTVLPGVLRCGKTTPHAPETAAFSNCGFPTVPFSCCDSLTVPFSCCGFPTVVDWCPLRS